MTCFHWIAKMPICPFHIVLKLKNLNLYSTLWRTEQMNLGDVSVRASISISQTIGCDGFLGSEIGFWSFWYSSTITKVLETIRIVQKSTKLLGESDQPVWRHLLKFILGPRNLGVLDNATRTRGVYGSMAHGDTGLPGRVQGWDSVYWGVLGIPLLENKKIKV